VRNGGVSRRKRNFKVHPESAGSCRDGGLAAGRYGLGGAGTSIRSASSRPRYQG
jgi:hypothetical protein